LALGTALAFHFHGVRAPRPAGIEALGGSQPLYDPADKPIKVNLKGVNPATGKWSDFPVTIRQSKSRLNQMKQAVLAFLEDAPRLDIPAGLSLNELYWSQHTGAVVDLSTADLPEGSMGFYEELLVVRGLIETLSKNFPEVRAVKILVNGQEAPTVAGHYALGTTEAAAPVAPAANPFEETYGNQ
ncbi:MAG TPA: GerMN domain-containing protein, partial [bacterium]|nr:GerMN domain-containing protein [bacterium]